MYDGDLLIGEVQIPSMGGPTPSAAYTWGAAGLVSERQFGISGSAWYHFGPQGETRQVTDVTGATILAYSYNAYGGQNQVLYPEGVTPFTNRFCYGGQFGYYSDFGYIILCGARWYDPGQGRWLSRDPIGYDGGDNLYAYCDGDPLGAIDPEGLDIDRGGHHYAPAPVRDYLDLSKEARGHFKKRTTGSVPGHDFTHPHPEYNNAARTEFEEFIKKRKIDVTKMTEMEAEEFIQALRNSKNPLIRTFIKECEDKAAAEVLRKAAVLAEQKLVAGAERQAVKEVEEQVGKKLAKKGAGALLKKFPVVGAVFFIYDWHEGGFGHAVNSTLWPVSLLWGGK